MLTKTILTIAFFACLAGCVEPNTDTGAVALVEPCGPPLEAPLVEEVYFLADVDGANQAYMLRYPTGFQGTVARDMLVTLHGHGSNRGQFINNPRDECRAARDFAETHEMLLVSPDYRQPRSWMGPKAESDVAQIIETLRATYAIDRVFIAGASMGGAGALTFTARRPELIAGVVSMNGHANLLEYTEFADFVPDAIVSYGGTKAEIPEEYKARSAEYWPERFTMPTALTVGSQDTVVPPHSVIRFDHVLRQIDRPVLLIENPLEDHRTNYADAMAAFEFVLGAP